MKQVPSAPACESMKSQFWPNFQKKMANNQAPVIKYFFAVRLRAPAWPNLSDNRTWRLPATRADGYAYKFSTGLPGPPQGPCRTWGGRQENIVKSNTGGALVGAGDTLISVLAKLWYQQIVFVEDHTH